MSDVLEKLNNQIEIDREILSVLPKNNKKNVKAYQDKAEEIKKEYASYLNDIVSEIKRRALKINSIVVNPKIAEISKEIEDMDSIKLLDANKTPFEKMELDEILYTLKRFYKNNLELVNSSILTCLEKFKMVGIELDLKDFNYSIYTKEYMKVLLEEAKKGELNSTIIKETFEQIYWKCPDIILHIELNFRSLYLKNEKAIKSYFDSKQKKLLKDLDIKKEQLFEKYDSLKLKLQEAKNKDTFLILQKFKNGEENARDYEESSIYKCYKKLINATPEEVEKDVLEEFNQNIEKMLNSLNEYKNYLKFKFLYDEVMAIYNEKQKYQKMYSSKYKQIQKLENKLFKENKKIEKYTKHKGLIARLFGRNQNKLEKINVDINDRVLQLKDVYRELEENKIKAIISSNLSKVSTIYDVIRLAASFYSFLVNIIIKQYPDMPQEEIIELIQEFREFASLPNVTIINNIKILENKDIILVIKDKYNLCNINLEKGDFSEENIEGIISTAKDICNYNYIKNSRLNLEDIKYILEATKILEQKDEQNNSQKSEQEDTKINTQEE